MDHDLPSPTVLGHLRQEGPRWYPELGPAPVDVTVLAHTLRARSAVTTVLLGHSVRAVVKVARPGATVEDRPRLGIGARDLPRRDHLEWNGLCLAWEAFGHPTRPGLAAVRPLAHLPDERAIVMSHLDGVSARAVVADASRAGRPGKPGPHDINVVLRRMGAWLATFHAQGSGTPEFRGSQAELATVAQTYASHLSARAPAAAALAARLAAEPPAGVPLGLGHGDFAPRNGIVTDEGEVAVIDVLGRWRLPILEDLALMLLELRSGGRQLLLAGHAFPAARLRAAEEALLDGYGGAAGSDVDRRALAWFVGLVLVDRWAAHLARPAVGPRARVRQAIVGRALGRETARARAALDVGAAW